MPLVADAPPAKPSQAKNGDYWPLGGTVTEEAHRPLHVCILSSHGTPEAIVGVLMHRAVSPVASAASTGFAFINGRAWNRTSFVDVACERAQAQLGGRHDSTKAWSAASLSGCRLVRMTENTRHIRRSAGPPMRPAVRRRWACSCQALGNPSDDPQNLLGVTITASRSAANPSGETLEGNQQPVRHLTFAEEEAAGREIPETRVLMTIVASPLEMMTPKETVPGRSRMLGWKLGKL
ncbi:hypothetical protein B0I37DRAFT_355928 [Chaetomium sp. MPI-CAGE-AT-0009]|nr:hypothetical protein B0I37DRAFT_355928 [Chaetomium sp. MPI-CAGE-AT-0009]